MIMKIAYKDLGYESAWSEWRVGDDNDSEEDNDNVTNSTQKVW